MAKKRILLMYISENSGHHHASLAIESALHEASNDTEIRNVNSFLYTNPILEKIINKVYMSVIRRRPEIWGYLYDNPKVVKSTQRLKEAIHKYASNKIKTLFEEFMPQAVICTQAFPCGIVADYKRTHALDMVVAGVLTDYAPHSYWLYDNVDAYFVPSEETKKSLILNGISSDKVHFTGIPIDLKFRDTVDKKSVFRSLGFSDTEPVILVMGGSQGIGPVKEIVKILNTSKVKLQVIVVAGGNKKLYNYLKQKVPQLHGRCVVFAYTEKINELMEISDLVISKPGGITVSEALSKGLPVLIVNPIPGQEEMNTRHLVKHKVAVKLDNLHDLEIFVKEFLSNPLALKNMQNRARALSRPGSAANIAETILGMIG